MSSYTAAVITVSDKGARGERADTSGPSLCTLLREHGWEITHTAIIPDEPEAIKSELIRCADELGVCLTLTTGGTGFSPRDVTPEATLAVIERAAPGIPEAMRAESMRITPRGCLSREAAGIRGRTLIVNLPGSEKASRETLLAVIGALGHGVDMLRSSGSADCASEPHAHHHPAPHTHPAPPPHSHAYPAPPPHSHAHSSPPPHTHPAPPPHDHAHPAPPPGEPNPLAPPSLDGWLREAKSAPDAAKCGMYLTHCGTVRESARARARGGDETAAPVRGMRFSCDREKLRAAIDETLAMDGIHCVRAWLADGELAVGDDIMRVLIGGDIRPRVIEALQHLVGKLKNECVTEEELF